MKPIRLTALCMSLILLCLCVLSAPALAQRDDVPSLPEGDVVQSREASAPTDAPTDPPATPRPTNTPRPTDPPEVTTKPSDPPGPTATPKPQVTEAPGAAVLRVEPAAGAVVVGQELTIRVITNRNTTRAKLMERNSLLAEFDRPEFYQDQGNERVWTFTCAFSEVGKYTLTAYAGAKEGYASQTVKATINVLADLPQLIDARLENENAVWVGEYTNLIVTTDQTATRVKVAEGDQRIREVTGKGDYKDIGDHREWTIRIRFDTTGDRDIYVYAGNKNDYGIPITVFVSVTVPTPPPTAEPTPDPVPVIVSVNVSPENIKAGETFTVTVVTRGASTRAGLTDSKGELLVETDTHGGDEYNPVWQLRTQIYEEGQYILNVYVANGEVFAETTVSIEVQEAGATTSPVMGSLVVGQVDIPACKPGASVTVLVPVTYLYINTRYNSNDLADPNVPGVYSQKICDLLSFVEISPELASVDSFPFELDKVGEARMLVGPADKNHPDVKSGKILEGTVVNNGFAEFNWKVKSTLQNGVYPIIFNVRYIDRADPENVRTEVQLTTYLRVSGAKTPGGNGGGGGGGVSKPDPQAKLIVSDVRTDPVLPKVGEEFDLVLVLQNTSEKQYVQNIKLSISSGEDALKPVSGSSSYYLKKLKAEESLEQRIRVSTSPDLAQTTINVDVNMEYEDSKVSPFQSQQRVSLEIEPVQRIKLDDVVIDYAGAIVGSSTTLTMNVFNMGRTKLYNVIVEPKVEGDIGLGPRCFIGDMTEGSSKPAEIELTPLAAGQFDGALVVTYEDHNGNAKTEEQPFSIFATAMDEEENNIDFNMPTPAPEPPTVMTVLQHLPWWVFAAVGGLLLLLLMLMAFMARRRRRRAMDDYEMD